MIRIGTGWIFYLAGFPFLWEIPATYFIKPATYQVTQTHYYRQVYK